MKQEVAEYDLEMSPAPSTVLDIGANIGAFALRARTQWPKATIRCYEPVMENYRALVKNISNCPKIRGVSVCREKLWRRGQNSAWRRGSDMWILSIGGGLTKILMAIGIFGA